MKSKYLNIAFCALILSACSKESSLKLELSDDILSFKPTYKTGPLYSSNGDTIQLSIAEDRSYFYEKGGLDGTFGPYEGIDRLIEERLDYRLASDSLGLNIEYRFAAIYEALGISLQNDFLLLSFSDSLNSILPEINLRYDGDTTLFLLNNTQFLDSVLIADKYFYNVLAQQSANGMALYMNNTGILGFTTSANRTYQIIN